MDRIRTVSIIGANGTMGRNISAIFASFGHADVYMISRSLEKSEEAKAKAFKTVRAESINSRLIPMDYSSLDECIGNSDLIFEACAEDFAIKKDIHTRIASVLSRLSESDISNKIICSGTSGLSITDIAEIYPEQIRHQVMGMHFFNPPYQMTLCEMIYTSYIKARLEQYDYMVGYARDILLRTVVECSDTPAFIGNRIGFQFINKALQRADEFKYSGGIDYIDAILGPFTGRSMAPLVTSDFVGLDVHKAIVDNIHQNTDDYANSDFVLPAYVSRLIGDGFLGRKSGCGLYKTIIHDSGVKLRQVYDLEHDIYRATMKYVFPFAEDMISFIRNGDYTSAFSALVNNKSTEAIICCKSLLEYIIYSLSLIESTGCSAEAIDDAMASGFHWCPPLALYEAFSQVTEFEKLCYEILDPDTVSYIKKAGLLKNVQKSGYDFRKFIVAKR